MIWNTFFREEILRTPLNVLFHIDGNGIFFAMKLMISRVFPEIVRTCVVVTAISEAVYDKKIWPCHEQQQLNNGIYYFIDFKSLYHHIRFVDAWYSYQTIALYLGQTWSSRSSESIDIERRLWTSAILFFHHEAKFEAKSARYKR